MVSVFTINLSSTDGSEWHFYFQLNKICPAFLQGLSFAAKSYLEQSDTFKFHFYFLGLSKFVEEQKSHEIINYKADCRSCCNI